MYENVPTFCFICGTLGHTERYCGHLFNNPKQEIVRPYGIWMRTPLRCLTKLIREWWLRNIVEEDNRNPAIDGEGKQRQVGIKIRESNLLHKIKKVTNVERILDGRFFKITRTARSLAS